MKNNASTTAIRLKVPATSVTVFHQKPDFNDNFTVINVAYSYNLS